MPIVQQNNDQQNSGSQQNPLASGQNPQMGQAQQQAQQSQVTTNRAESANVSQQAPQQAPGAQSTRPQSQRSSGRFTNLQNFIRANQTPQGGFGQRFAQKVGEKTQQAGQQVQQSKQEFEKQIGAEVEKQKQDREQAQAGLAQLTQKPAENVNVQEAASQVRQAQTREFAAPKELGNLSEIERARQDAQSITQAAQTETGRFGALQQLFGRQGYNRGQQRLDNLLVGQSGQDAARALQKTSTEARGLDSRINRELEASRQASGQTRQQLADQQAYFRRQAIEGLGTRRGELETEIAARNAALEADAAEITDQELDDAIATDPTVANLINLGLTRDQIKRGLSQQVQQANLGNFDRTGAEQLNALAELGGLEDRVNFTDQGPGIQKGLSDAFRQQANLANQELLGLQGGANFEDYAQTGEPFQRDAIVNLFNQSPQTANLIASIPASGAANAQQKEAVINLLDPIARQRYVERENAIKELQKPDPLGRQPSYEQKQQLFALINEQNKVFADARNSTLRNLDQITRNQRRRDIISRIGNQ